MGWFKVDDQLAFNAKIITAGNEAMGLWVRAGSWSCAQLTGGFIAKAMANAMANECDANALVMAGLWDEVEGGYQFHDWDEFQPDAAAEKEKRKRTLKARSDAGKAGAQARWGNKSDGKPDGKRNGKTIANQWQNDAPDPTRPDKEASLLSDDGEARKRPTKLPKDWAPTASHIERAKENRLDLGREAEAFKLHAETHDRRAANWNAAFTTWLTKAQPQSQSLSPWSKEFHK